MIKLEQAQALIEQGQVQSAAGLIAPILDKEPTNAQARFLLGICFFRTQRFGLAEGLFRSTIALQQSHTDATYYLGLTLERQKRISAAIKCYRAVLVLNPSYTLAQKKIAQLDHQSTTTSNTTANFTTPPPQQPTQSKKQKQIKGWRSSRTTIGCAIAAIRWLVLLALGTGLGIVVGGSIAQGEGAVIGGIAGLFLSHFIQALVFKRER